MKDCSLFYGTIKTRMSGKVNGIYTFYHVLRKNIVTSLQYGNIL